MRKPLRLLALLVSVSLLGTVSGCGVFGGSSTRRFSADFDRAIGVYPHSDVRVLGVKIGQVTKIIPRGTKIHVEGEYDSSYKIPKDVSAVLLAPSIVSDRYVQLTPAYTSGDTLPDKAFISHTSQPVELDQIYQSLDGLDVALGPEGANKHGALSDLLKVGADNLGGNGDALHGTLEGLSKAVSTLATSRGDLFSTISNLQQFTTVIAQNDSTVRAFDTDLAAVAAQLNGERTDLATAIKQLSVALAQVAQFVKENKDNLTYNITTLASVTKVLVTQKRALKEFLDTAPTALSNLQLAYNSTSGTLDTRDNSTSQGGPVGVLCNLLAIAGQSPTACNAALGGVVPKQAGTSSRDLTLGGILLASS
jgi:phospholipid/cholesterol/gamma-HCH transport system substrate-binding protein